MIAYLTRRLIQMAAVTLFTSMIIYFFLYLAPGGPLAGLRMSADPRSTPSDAQIAKMAEYMGLHRGPVWGYVAWLTGEDWLSGVGRADLQRPICRESKERCGKGVIRGDFGISWSVAKGSTVSSVLAARLRNTLLLSGMSVLLSLLLAIPIGIYSAIHQYSKMDYVLTTFSFFGSAMPVFWFGLIMIILFGGNQSILHKMTGLPYLPPGNVSLVRAPMAGSLHDILNVTPRSWMDTAIHLVMPVVVLSLLSIAGWSRFMRASMLEVLRQDYVRTARSKGLAERFVIYKHALRNALLPLITIVVLTIPGIFGGAIITETIFNWIGMGQLFIRALGSNDYPVSMAFLFISAVLTVLATLIGDILYTVVDPRIRFS
ncbi:MAG: ABC transporter permease [Ardenticatenales bacterium]|nr:ABC transporter permease [Ardenticatenales bacterium]